MAADSPIPRHPKVKDETGKTYGNLSVIGYAGSEKHHGCNFALWRCRCKCGAVITTRGNSLRTGNTTSCSRTCKLTRHGHARKGGRRTPEHRCWTAMVQRCENPRHKSFHNYGGRGIRVCDRWRESFENFLADMGCRPGPEFSIDRIDVNGHYEPANCRWATKREQDNNRRTNRRIEFRGEVRTLTQWAELLGVHPVTLYYRLTKYGWPLEKALTTPRSR